MIINELMTRKKISKYRLAKDCGIPYTTIEDICSGRTELLKCSAETISCLAQGLNVSMEDLLDPLMMPRISFELYKSNVCHQLNRLGDIGFIIQTLKTDSIRSFYQRGWYPESLYLLAMLDYLSRENSVPLCTRYDDLRHCRLSSPIYPSSVLAIAAAENSERAKRQAVQKAIPEFLNFNIIESEVCNVI